MIDEDPIADVPWHQEFVKVLKCAECNAATDKNLLRDSNENVPQPGYIGRHYDRSKLLLVGQNPGLPNERLGDADRVYTAALRALRDTETVASYSHLQGLLDDFIPTWPVHGQYFPLVECGLVLEEIAYCNLVRCRTSRAGQKYSPPNKATAATCRTLHFQRWLDLLKPRAVIFIGLWASQAEGGGKAACDARGIPSVAVNRSKGLKKEELKSNRSAVIEFVRKHIPGHG
ncbi:hypothetical protein [Methylocystis echinoides]|uniref:hypothetical protein n=1 Tax=Methylocystis echinoides TaxID=29468 RepID=UPI003420DBA1